MIYLSSSALKYAVNICEELPKYRVGIALLHRSDSEPIIDILATNIKDVEVKIVKSKFNPRIEFSNGSYIGFIDTSDNSRAFALNLLIVEYGIDREIINCVLCPCEKINYYDIYNMEIKNKCYDKEI